MERWVGKVAIVTGASAGIGKAIAAKLVESGLQVVGLARRVELIRENARQLAKYPGKLHAIKADMTKEEDILEAFKWTVANLGPVHILVNNAGVITDTPLIETDTHVWRNLLDINVLGLCIATREAVQNMRKNNVDGHIVHINSVCGHSVLYKTSLYTASKYAVTCLTEVLRNELRDAKTKIKVTSISPGIVETELIASGSLDVYRPMPQLDPVDIADALIYALSTPPNVQVHELVIKPLGEAF